MKLCMPTENNVGKESIVYGHFGSAPYFLIYDTESKSFETIENLNEHHAHGTCNPIESLAGKSVNAVVCKGMGLRAIQKLNQGGVKAFISEKNTVSEVVDDFLKGDLNEMTVDFACSDHSCH